MQAAPTTSTPPANTNSLPDKSENVLGALSFSGESLPELPEASTDVPLPAAETSLFSPDIHANSPSPVVPPEIESNPEPVVSALPEPLSQTPPAVSGTLTPSPTLPLEKIEKEEISTSTSEIKKEIPPDSKLAQYLQADSVYQAMIRVESQEKIRLQLAIRYTLLMFAIFLVFAWIVSNRIIMFGFSEFLWLARIRDGLFAVMAGLFSLTLWFGSVAWMRQPLLIALFRTLAIVFFSAVIVALYIPLW